MSACPSGKKHSFSSKAEAKRYLRRIRGGESRTHERPRHVYECPLCGAWHMTSGHQHYAGGEGGIGKCRACPADILWARMPSGKANPLDLETVACEERKGVVAYDPRDGSGTLVTIGNVEELRGRDGLSFHVSHFSSCSARRGSGAGRA